MVGVVCGKDWPAFEVPSSEVRQGAIGDTRSAGETWQELLLPHAEDFEPIGVPAPRDWLASRQEFGQTFREYLLGRRNGVTPAKSTVYLVPLGDYGESEVAPEMVVLADFVRLYYRVRAVVLPQVGLVDLGVVSRTGRQGQLQLHSAAVLDRLEKRVPENGFALIGVTMEDLYPAPEWNYIFGQARVGKRVGVFSFARYDPRVWGAVLEDDEAKAKRVVLERGCKVLGHEAGHLFGMLHCIYFRCVMNGSNHIGEADSRPVHLCPVCLRKAGSATGLNPVLRYRGLARFYREKGMDEAAEWCERRVVRGRRAGSGDR